MKKTIIFDVDGVLIDWSSQLPLFCKRHGIDPVLALKHYTAKEHVSATELFGVPCESTAFELLNAYNREHGRYMTAFPDAVDEVHKLARDYNLIALTKFGDGFELWRTRKYNLETFFPGCFSELISISYLESKLSYVLELQKKHNVIAFIDDQMENINVIQRNTDIPTIHLNRYDEHSDAKHMKEVRDLL